MIMKYNLEVERNGKVVNHINGEGEKAYIKFIECLGDHCQRRKINKVPYSKIVKITQWFNNNENVGNYVYRWQFEDDCLEYWSLKK